MQQLIHHGEDIIFKSVARVLGDELVRSYGLEPCRIVGPAPTEIDFTVGERRLDYLYVLEDDRLLHLEFRSSPAKLEEFLVYDALLYRNVRKMIRTVIIYTGKIRRAPSRIQAGCLNYQTENVFLFPQDGEAARGRAEERLRAGDTLSDKELLDLIFSPLMRQSIPPGKAVLAAVDVASKIADEEVKTFCLASIIGLGDKFLDEQQRKKALEVLRMTRIAELFVEEGMEKGMEKGRAEGLVEGRVGAVLLLLERRFGEVPAGMAETIRRQEREDILSKLLLEVVVVGSLEEFQAKLVQIVPN